MSGGAAAQLQQITHDSSVLFEFDESRFAALQNNRWSSCHRLGNMPNLHKLAFENNMWLMPQQEVLSWSEEHRATSS